MIAVVSMPVERADELVGQRIWPFSVEFSGRAYALAEIPNASPIALAMVLFRDDDRMTIRWFENDRAAILWATRDALERGLA